MLQAAARTSAGSTAPCSRCFAMCFAMYSGISAPARQHVGRERVLEDQPEEVEPRLRLDDSAVVLRLAVAVEHRQVDPAEVRSGSRCTR